MYAALPLRQLMFSRRPFTIFVFCAEIWGQVFHRAFERTVKDLTTDIAIRVDEQMKSITTSLMFVGEQAGKAEEAIRFYTSLFPGSQITDIQRYGAGELEPEGSTKMARFRINGTEFLALDSHLDHQFNFTPSMSLYVECESSSEIEEAFRALADGGSELMPLDNYGFSQKFGWLKDRYGVSWQLNLSD